MIQPEHVCVLVLLCNEVARCRWLWIEDLVEDLLEHFASLIADGVIAILLGDERLEVSNEGAELLDNS